MKIYRVEHPETGLGAYRHFDSTLGYDEAVRITEPWDQMDNTPGPQRDGCQTLTAPPEVFNFGFSTLKQARVWFRFALSDLEKFGFELVRYEAPKTAVVKCRHQVAFIKSLAELCATLPMSKLREVKS